MTRGHVGWLALFCLAVSSGACASRQETAEPTQPRRPQENPDMTKPLDCAMSVAPSLRAGEPVEVRFRLTNRTAQPLFVLKWHTPLEGLLANYLQVTRDGVELPYEGPMMKRGDPQASHYVAIAPGASVEAQVDVSLAYDVRQPGRYRIAFRDSLMDVTSKEAEVPRSLAQFQATPVQCPEIETTLTSTN